MRCLSDEQIARLADAASNVEGRAALEAHADDCAACRERLRVARHAATTRRASQPSRSNREHAAVQLESGRRGVSLFWNGCDSIVCGVG